MFEENADVVIIEKKQKVDPAPTDGKLKIRVHIISLSDKFAFSKTKRNYPFEIPNAAKYMINFNTEKPELNTDPARIDSSMIHEMVISYFGTNAKTMFDIVNLGAETQELINASNTNNPKYDVSYFEAIVLQNIQ